MEDQCDVGGAIVYKIIGVADDASMRVAADDSNGMTVVTLEFAAIGINGLEWGSEEVLGVLSESDLKKAVKVAKRELGECAGGMLWTV